MRLPPNEPLLQLFRELRRCEWCGAKVDACDPDHIHTRGAGRLDVRVNLIGLCRPCHNKKHNGQITRRQLLEYVARRERTTVWEIEAAVWALRRLPKGAEVPADLAAYLAGPPNLPRRAKPSDAIHWYTMIGDDLYLVEAIPPKAEGVLAAWQFTKAGGEFWHIHVDRYGPHCTCQAGTYRCENSPQKCKHVRAMLAAGIMVATWARELVGQSDPRD